MANWWEEIPKSLQSLEGVPEDFHPLFVQDKDTGGFKQHSLRPLRDVMNKQKQDLQELNLKIANYEKTMAAVKDIDPARYRELEEQVEQLTAERGDQAEAIRRATAAADERYSKILKSKDESASSAMEGWKRTTQERAIDRAMLERDAPKAKKGREDLIRDLMAKRVAVEDKDGKMKAVVYDPTRPGIYDINKKTGSEMTPRDVLDDLAENFPEMFEGTRNGGSGSGGADTTTSVPSDTTNILNWTQAQKDAYKAEFGHKKYREVVLAAGKKNAEDMQTKLRGAGKSASASFVR